MNKLTELIKRHQVVAFFVLVFAISWGLWIPSLPFIFSGKMPFLTPLLVYGAFAPGLVGIIITRIIDTGPRQGAYKSQWIAFMVAWVVATVIFVLNVVLTSKANVSVPAMVGISAMFALAPAFVISSVFSRVQGVRNYLASLVKPKGDIKWYLVTIFLLPAVHLLGVTIMLLLDQQVKWKGVTTLEVLPLTGMIIFVFIYQFVYSNCLGEETGWRGFALPKLQIRYSPLIASLIIGIFWAVWHFPVWRYELGLANYQYLLYLSGSTFSFSFILTWLYNRTGGSIFAVGLMHVTGNLGPTFIRFLPIWTLLGLILALIVIVADKMWQKLPSDSDGGLVSVPQK